MPVPSCLLTRRALRRVTTAILAPAVTVTLFACAQVNTALDETNAGRAATVGSAAASPQVIAGMRSVGGDAGPVRFVEGTGDQWIIEVPQGMLAALERWDGSFRPWARANYEPEIRGQDTLFSSRRLPWVVVADLTGDGREDVVLAGETSGGAVLVALIADAADPLGYRVVSEGAYAYSEEGEGTDISSLPHVQYVLRRVDPPFYQACTEQVPLPNGGFAFTYVWFNNPKAVWWLENGEFAETAVGC